MVSDTIPIQTRHADLHWGRDTGVLLTGTALIAVSMLSPWFQTEGLAVSGGGLALAGYPFLWALPLFGISALILTFRSPGARPAVRMLPGITGLLCLFLFASMVVNGDDGALRLVLDKHLPPHIRITLDGETHMVLGAGNTGPGIYLALAGLLLICGGPLLRPGNPGHPPVTGDAAGCRSGRAKGLQDLQTAWTTRGEVKIAAGLFFVGGILIFTYTWCGVSPLKVWENRGNAREYLFGRALSDSDMAYIDDQTARAPEIEAQGRAREFQDNKYRSVPVDQQPGLEEKMKENDALVARFLSEMGEEEKTELRKKARAYALKEKEGGYFPPETASPKVRGYVVALLETVAIAIWGTLLAIVFAVPAALFAARNTLKVILPGDGRASRAMRWFAVFGVRRFLDACRGFNEFVMALIFVAVIGLGPFAGILALWIHTFGILGKVFSEQIEAIDPGQVEALSSTGASVDQVIAFSVLPQVMPGFVSYALLRFESNVRSATILGFVGAGGIGFLMFDKLNGYLFREVCTMMIIIIVSVSVIDFFCGKLRSRFI